MQPRDDRMFALFQLAPVDETQSSIALQGPLDGLADFCRVHRLRVGWSPSLETHLVRTSKGLVVGQVDIDPSEEHRHGASFILSVMKPAIGLPCDDLTPA